MGIVNRTHKTTYLSITNDGSQKEILPLQNIPEYDSDELETTEAGCEYALCEGQVCNIPYDLYNLPDLKEIVCLETWNFCLTEEERLTLAAHLPDLDLQTFSLTMKELLNGDSLYFGNPLEKFFIRLRGGLYSPQVTQMRECLSLLQRRVHYHTLRSYQDQMIEKFADMARLWSECEPSTSIEERVQIWNNKLYKKPVLLVDLNSLPTDVESLTPPLFKETKYMDSMANNCDLSINEGARGVIKIKEVNLLENKIIQRSPKGVLKIKPRLGSNSLVHGSSLRMLRTPQKQVPIDFIGVSPSNFSVFPFGPSRNIHSYSQNRQSVFRTSHQAMSSLDNSGERDPDSFPSEDDSNFAINSNKTTKIGNFPHEKDLLQNFGKAGSLHSESAPVFSTNCSRDSDLRHQYDSRREDPTFPLTYKRRKTQRKLQMVDSTEIQSISGHNLESSSVTVSLADVKARGIKIKFKGEAINL